MNEKSLCRTCTLGRIKKRHKKHATLCNSWLNVIRNFNALCSVRTKVVLCRTSQVSFNLHVFQYLITFLIFIIKIETLKEIVYNSTSLPLIQWFAPVWDSNYHYMIDTYFSNGNGNENIRTEMIGKIFYS